MRAQAMTQWAKGLRVFVLLAFLARALVPPGFMFEAEAGTAEVKVVLCSAHGSIEAYIDRVTGEISYAKKEPKQAGKDDPSCPFAAIAKLAPPSHVTFAFAPHEVPTQHSRARSDMHPGRGLSAPPPPATGPPVQIV